MKNVVSVLMLFFLCAVVWAEEFITIVVEVPDLEAEPYHRPYVAIWLETEEREPIETIALWVEQEDWLKDLRQWWRKLGRRTWGKSEQLDSVTGATRKPGTYELTWSLKNPTEEKLVLHLEAAREEGGRSYIRQDIDLNQSQSFSFPKEGEFGDIKITIHR